MTRYSGSPSLDSPCLQSGAQAQCPGRRDIYYWKCDRPSAFHGVQRGAKEAAARRDAILPDLRHLLARAFPGRFELSDGAGKGNHLTWRMEHGGSEYFVRVEDGPEGDAHMEVESCILRYMAGGYTEASCDRRACWPPVPRVYFTDATRRDVPFAVQVIEYLPATDLNELYKTGRVALPRAAEEIGRAVAQWQAVPVRGFGHFEPKAATVDNGGRLAGYHSRYADYFTLNLERHLEFLMESEFVGKEGVDEIARLVTENWDLLDIPAPCLVHKDLALWNILASADATLPGSGGDIGIVRIRAFIDWDDAIAGDPMDDLSLLAAFYSGNIVHAAMRGYASVRPLPDNAVRRLWLHLLRNMLVKAVIRCGAGYFQNPGFLGGAGQSGEDLRRFTLDRLRFACEALRSHLPVEALK